MIALEHPYLGIANTRSVGASQVPHDVCAQRKILAVKVHRQVAPPANWVGVVVQLFANIGHAHIQFILNRVQIFGDPFAHPVDRAHPGNVDKWDDAPGISTRIGFDLCPIDEHFVFFECPVFGTDIVISKHRAGNHHIGEFLRVNVIFLAHLFFSQIILCIAFE